MKQETTTEPQSQKAKFWTMQIFAESQKFEESLIKSGGSVKIDAEILNGITELLRQANPEAMKLPFGFVKAGVKSVVVEVVKREISKITSAIAKDIQNENQ